MARRMGLRIPASVNFDTVLHVSLVILTKPSRTSRIVRHKPEEDWNTGQCDDAFDKEKPAEAFESSGTIELSDSIGDGAIKCTGC